MTAGTAACCLLAGWLWGGAALPACGDESTNNADAVRLAFSAGMFADVNENDAKASVKAWALALGREKHVAISADPIILAGVADLQQSLKTARIDGAAVTTEEFLGLEPELQGTNLFMSYIEGRFTEEYLLLVRADSDISDLRGLQGRKVILFDNIRASLAPLWLDVLLSDQKLGAPAEYFGQILKAQKLVKVVLPVFFHQQDACIVTRRGFQTMCEMNPQVRAQLRVLAKSPELVPSVGFLRRGFDTPLRDRMVTALRGLEKSVSGTQVLTLFQIDQFQEAPASLLSSAIDLVAAHRRLKPVFPSVTTSHE